MNPALIIAINAFALINRLRAAGAWDEVRADYEVLRAQLTAELPTKPDGTAYTDEDLRALADETYARNAAIRDRHSADGTGHP